MLQGMQLINSLMKLPKLSQTIRLCSTASVQEYAPTDQRKIFKENINVELCGSICGQPHITQQGHLFFPLKTRQENRISIIPVMTTSRHILKNLENKINIGDRIYASGRLAYKEHINEEGKKTHLGIFLPGRVFNCTVTGRSNMSYDVNDVTLVGKVINKLPPSGKGILLFVQTGNKTTVTSKVHSIWIPKGDIYPIAETINVGDKINVHGHITTQPIKMNDTRTRIFINANKIVAILSDDESNIANGI